MIKTKNTTRREEFIAGLKDTIPLIVGAIPFGFIFGALAVTGAKPLSPAAAMSMSLFVFAGSAQFIGVGLYSQSIALGLIVLTTFIVNLRHALYAASLAPYMKHVGHKWLLPLGFWLTDETYAVVIRRFQENPENPNRHWYFFASALFMYVNWQICTLIGILVGQNIGDAASWGLDFAMVVTFIGIIVPLIINRPMLVCAVVASITSIAVYNMPNKLGYMVAGIIGIIAGLLAETWTSRNTDNKLKNTPSPASD